MNIQFDAADGIHRVEDSFTNWYLVQEDRRLTVVDSGVPTSWQSLQEVLRRLGARAEDVAAVVLTHGHFDHLGFAEQARQAWNVPVFVHENDVPLTQHPWRYDHERPRAYYFATQLRALPIVASLVRNRAFWPSPVKQVNRFSDGQLPVPGSPTVVFTPGHTHGHCALHFPERNAVIAGDSVVTLDPYTGRKGPRIVARAATVDSARNLQALDALARTQAHTVLVGHGVPWTNGAEEIVNEARRAGAS
ncbi:MAG: MBL fold metallo-hydrolase [Solirubrobacterales bacterium]|nr:MBL fold metallo-hydrolase [Solirubrobacterales bacterium]